MKNLIKSIMLLLTGLVLAGFFRGVPVKAAEGSPVIAITYAPPYNVKRPIRGQVFMEDKSEFDPSDYRISLFLQVEEGRQYWIKPYYDEPYVDIFEDGSFSGKFVTGGEDKLAKVLHVMLIPADYTPSTFSETKAAALDYVKITRTESGENTVVPQRKAPPPPGVPSVDPQMPVSEDKIAVNIGFYTDGSRPGDKLSELLIRRQLTAVSKFSDTIRLFGSAGELAKAYPIAHEMGFTVVGTAWLSGDETADRTEMDALIEHCNNGYVRMACVGSEALLRGNLTAQELVTDINYVREGLEDKSIPVTTADTLEILLNNSYVCSACNVLFVNEYPYWEHRSISDAPNVFINAVEEIKAVYGDKPVLVSETGWPTDGQTLEDAVPGEAEAAEYFDAVRSWSLSTGTQIFWFGAADEPWKSNEGAAGSHWGLLTTDFELKDGYAGTEFFKAHPYDGPGAIDISNAVVSGLTDRVYTGAAFTQTPTVKLGSITLAEGTDYTVSFNNNTNAGTAVVTVTGTGSYTGTATGNFTIAKAEPQLVFEESSITKTHVDSNFRNALLVKIGGAVTYKSSDSSVAAVNASSGEVTIKGIGTATITATAAEEQNYKAGSASYTVNVIELKLYLTNCEVKLDQTEFTYDGTAKKPKVTVTNDAAALTEGEEYEVTYGENIYPPTGTVTVTGLGIYHGTRELSFTIDGGPIRSISLSETDISMDCGTARAVPDVTYEPDFTTDEKKVEWSSSDSSVAAVQNGTIKALKAGTAVLTASVPGREVSASVEVNVSEVEPVIAFTYIPPYNVSGMIEGRVFMEDGREFDPSDYRISLFLQVNEGGQYWIKPYYDETYVSLREDGSFSGKFITGGNDRLAVALHVMLVPGDYTPENFPDTRAAALDYVKITRTEEGGITVDPARAFMSGLTEKVYTGREITQDPVLTFGAETLEEGTDYTLSFADNIKPGIASVIAAGEGRYSGTTFTGRFRILFTDVTKKNIWYYDPVYWALDNKVTAGMGPGTFQPTVQLTRAQAVTFLYNMAGSPDVSGLNAQEFSDVAPGAWYYSAVKWAAANGITSGMGPGIFQPEKVCTRAMIVTFLRSYAKYAGVYKDPKTEANFTDVPTGEWYKKSVDWAVENKVTSGMGSGTFRPTRPCDRAMMVSFLRKVDALPIVD